MNSYSYTNIVNPGSKKVLLRTCLNLPVDAKGNISDYTRFYESLPTILELGQSFSKVILLAHMGRPKDKESSLSLAPIAEKLETELKAINVSFSFVKTLMEAERSKSKVVLLENIRFFEFTGGEPLLIEEQFDTLRKCINIGSASKIEVHYNTNGTVYPDLAIKDIWPKFKRIELAK